ncbi:MAG: Lipid core - O-antigen ligase, partial [Gemmatimonadetes bacterium]|nr:Lipid core - O-antigen ligase [Gemmatimonadota bacterium]
HNIFIQCMAELGYVGLFVFLLLIFATLKMNRQTRKIARAGPGPPDEFVAEMANGLDAAMVGFLVSGFFITVLYYPYFWINLALTTALNTAATVRAQPRFRQQARMHRAPVQGGPRKQPGMSPSNV